MKLRNLYSVFSAIFIAFSIISCDDDIDSIGQTIQPGTDDIQFEIDNIQITAETTPLKDYIYIDNEKVLLGELNDPIFGHLKADFLAEFYCGGGTDAQFKLGYDNEAQVDSIRLMFAFTKNNFYGDTIKPMTVSVYELTKNLETNFYTNVDPGKYCDMKTVLGQRFFSIHGLSEVLDGGEPTGYLDLDIEIDKGYGEKLYKAWKNDNKVLSSSDELKKVLKGIYVTTDFSDKGIISLAGIKYNISTFVYYSYKLKKVNDSKTDSIVTSYIELPMGYDVNKLNRVVNSSWADIKDIPGNSDFDTKTLVKAPAGVVTELNIPLADIKAKGVEKIGDEKFSINSAVFKLTGFTEEENNLAITKRPDCFLLIDKDSIDNFFSKKKQFDGITSIPLVRDATTNTYNLSPQGYIYTSSPSTSYTNNLSTTINHYLKKDPEKKELKLIVIPVDATTTALSDTQAQITKIENLLAPEAAIFRTKEDYMKMSLSFSTHKGIK